VGYCHPSGLEKTLFKSDIYVPLVTKGLTYFLFKTPGYSNMNFINVLYNLCYAAMLLCSTAHSIIFTRLYDFWASCLVLKQKHIELRQSQETRELESRISIVGDIAIKRFDGGRGNVGGTL
jgi:hypothetical protein